MKTSWSSWCYNLVVQKTTNLPDNQRRDKRIVSRPGSNTDVCIHRKTRTSGRPSRFRDSPATGRRDRDTKLCTQRANTTFRSIVSHDHSNPPRTSTWSPVFFLIVVMSRKCVPCSVSNSRNIKIRIGYTKIINK